MGREGEHSCVNSLWMVERRRGNNLTHATFLQLSVTFSQKFVAMALSEKPAQKCHKESCWVLSPWETPAPF